MVDSENSVAEASLGRGSKVGEAVRIGDPEVCDPAVSRVLVIEGEGEERRMGREAGGKEKERSAWFVARLRVGCRVGER